ncbi:MAG: accessory gene regulator ArgB-like protein [Lachnospiraceae bacterium]
MSRINRKIIDYMVQEEIISKEDEEYWDYQIEMIEGKILHALIVIVNTILSKHSVLFFTYAVCFSALRKNTGGYHASTKNKCTILSILWYCIVNYYLLDAVKQVNSVYLFLVLGVCIGIILAYAPVKHPNLLLTVKETKTLRKRSIGILVLELGISILLYQFWKDISVTIMLSIISCSFFITISKIIKQEDKVNEGFKEDT